jgi:hypothetical protein
LLPGDLIAAGLVDLFWQIHLGQPYRSEADYWASHLGPTLDGET